MQSIELITNPDPSKNYVEIDPDFEGVILVKKSKISVIPYSEFSEEFKAMNEIINHGVEIKKTNGETLQQQS
jgi:hypothetical protein